VSGTNQTLSAIVSGSGPDLVFIHGLFGSGENLKGTGKVFEDRYRVHYPDLPNHGSSPHTENATYATMTAMMRDYLRENTRHPVLVGHSMGAKVAMLCALEDPESVRALGVLDMAPRRYEPSHMDMMVAMLAVPLDEVASRSDADAFLASAIPERFVRSFLLKSLSKQPDGTYRWQLNLPALMNDYDDILGWPGSGSYGGPALFVGGTRSKYLNADRDRELIQSLFPHSEIHMLEGAGHWIHSERPEEIRELLVSFLDAVPDR
jgi:esterase